MNPLLCKVFGTTNIKWYDANWKWSECGIDCWKWSDTDVLWKDSNWWWSMCLTNNTLPDITPPIISEIKQYTGVSAETLVQPWLIEPWNPYKTNKKNKLIKLICKIKGIDYDSQKEIKDINLDINSVKFTINKNKNIDINANLEE